MKRNKRIKPQDAYDILLAALTEICALDRWTVGHDPHQGYRDRLRQAGRIARKALADSKTATVIKQSPLDLGKAHRRFSENHLMCDFGDKLS